MISKDEFIHSTMRLEDLIDDINDQFNTCYWVGGGYDRVEVYFGRVLVLSIPISFGTFLNDLYDWYENEYLIRKLKTVRG